MSILLTTLNEFGLHLVNNLLFLLTHRLTQGITLTTSKVCQLARKQHHLFLINCNAISILQVFLHTRKVIGNLLPTRLASNKSRDIVHGPRSIEGIHGNKILKYRGLQLPQVSLHTLRLKLECTNRPTLLIQLICLRVIHRDIIQININAPCQLDISHSFLQLRQSLQTQKVHLD